MIKYFLILITFIKPDLHSQSDKISKIDSIIYSKVEKNHPGLGVGVIIDGKIIYEKYRGLSNLQHQIPFNEKTRSNIASTAKQFTALMILDLSIKKQLKLDDDIRKYLPSLYPNTKDRINIRHLINHTSGIHEYVELLDQQGLVWWKHFGLDNDKIIKLLEGQRDLKFNPGTKYNYSNSNYNILAKIIEIVSKEKFTNYSKTFFFNLGMKETSFVNRYMEVIPNRANPYSDWGIGEWWETPTVTKTNGEGFLYTTLRDQLIYEKMLQTSDNKLLTQSQLSIPKSKFKEYGFGLKLSARLGKKAIHHDGVTFGFHSQTLRFPNDRLTIFILSNNGNFRSDLMADEIASLFFQ
mgnify:FL=1|tara:strand:+ start:1319 stop:2371 length:1053 start_codon:yes stop_codon:yes gene_type:complete